VSSSTPLPQRSSGTFTSGSTNGSPDSYTRSSISKSPDPANSGNTSRKVRPTAPGFPTVCSQVGLTSVTTCRGPVYSAMTAGASVKICSRRERWISASCSSRSRSASARLRSSMSMTVPVKRTAARSAPSPPKNPFPVARIQRTPPSARTARYSMSYPPEPSGSSARRTVSSTRSRSSGCSFARKTP